MPGKLYFYVNFGTIKRNIKGSKVKSYARPLLRDLEWMFFYNWEEARGFSGFINDPEYSAHNALKEELTEDQLKKIHCTDESGEFDENRYKILFKEDGTKKTYIPAREYMRMAHKGNYGAPTYFNESMNFMMLGSRGFGKDVHSKSIV